MTTANAQKTVRIAAANVNISLGGTPPALSVTNGSGFFVVTSAGVAGTISGTITLNIPDVTLSGQLEVDINNSATAINQTIMVGTTTATLNLPAGPFFRVNGTGINLTIAGQTLQTDLSIEQATRADGTKVLKFAANNLQLDIGGGLVTVHNGQGLFLSSPAGFAGKVSATVALQCAGHHL